jgi:predicted RNase H-like nuclease (RuvC/YqgF family)
MSCLLFAMQKQLEGSQKQKAHSESERKRLESTVAELQRELHAAQAEAEVLQKHASEASKQADAEVRQLRLLEERAMRGDLSLKSAIETLEKTTAELPRVENAQQRLLGIKMGADVRIFDTAGQASDSEGQPERWIPAVGDPVLVRAFAHTSMRPLCMCMCSW